MFGQPDAAVSVFPEHKTIAYKLFDGGSDLVNIVCFRGIPGLDGRSGIVGCVPVFFGERERPKRAFKAGKVIGCAKLSAPGVPALVSTERH